LISFGAVLGVTTPLQLIVMAICEMAVFATNEHLGLAVLKISDVGASILVHVFGAYFGLAVSAVLNNRPDRKKSANEIENDKEGASYNSDLSAMIGFIYIITNFCGIVCDILFYSNQEQFFFGYFGPVLMLFLPLLKKLNRGQL